MMTVILDKLDENPAGAFRVNECDPMPAAARTWLLVDEPHAEILEVLERLGERRDGEADVMKARTTTGEEAGHGGAVTRGGHELDVAVADLEHSLFDLVACDNFPALECGPEGLLPEVYGGVEIGHGDGDLIDAVQLHVFSSTFTAAGSTQEDHGAGPGQARVNRRVVRPTVTPPAEGTAYHEVRA